MPVGLDGSWCMMEYMSSNLPMAGPGDVTDRLDEFFDLFTPTIELVEHLIKTRSSPQEIVLLLCARLDALASSITSEDQSNREAFIGLLVKYSGHRELMQRVSAGDLYYELGFHRWLAEGLIPKPGRVHKFSDLNDPVIELLDRSGIPLTVDDAVRLLSRAMRAVAARFRCAPGQPLKKPMMAKRESVLEALRAEFQRSADSDIRQNLEVAFQPLLQKKTAASILYENFRNNAVHGVRVEIEEAMFFKAQKPYWQPLHSEFYPPFFFLKFPASFLVELLRNCLKTLRRQMSATQKMPPDVHFHAFGPGTDHLQFLDQELLPKGRDLRLKLK
jgi:hypothetical protein